MNERKPGPKDSSNKRASREEGPESMNPSESTKSTLSPERLEALREWVASGAFDSAEVIETVARRMLDRGDIRSVRRDVRIDPRDGFGPLVH